MVTKIVQDLANSMDSLQAILQHDTLTENSTTHFAAFSSHMVTLQGLKVLSTASYYLG
jgi:hypothetical protein